MSEHKKYMQRTLDLAAISIDWVSPNPMVGCVIVYQDKILAEGWHRKYGLAHAEVNAINQLSQKFSEPETFKKIASEATVYVSLEPCAHQGKTPPCADLLIEKGFRNVVVACTDPNPLVAGKGIEKLKDAGVNVLTGILEESAIWLNKRFFTAIKEHRPYIILKWAETADGYIAHPDGKSTKISSPFVDLLVHRWRSEEDAILVGAKTWNLDQPVLDARLWPEAKNPLRLVLGRETRLQGDFKKADSRFIYYTESMDTATEIEQIGYPDSSESIKFMLNDLYKKGVHSILVEGGPEIHNLFLKAGLCDEIRKIKSKTLVLKNGIAAAQVPAGYVLESQEEIQDNMLSIYLR
jgi:diaminohydroxyphosphoribosylaminopyrimidine deaminase / 5-amino-6-(5-phosphoribosylamino)uracil reductase